MSFTQIANHLSYSGVPRGLITRFREMIFGRDREVEELKRALEEAAVRLRTEQMLKESQKIFKDQAEGVLREANAELIRETRRAKAAEEEAVAQRRWADQAHQIADGVTRELTEQVQLNAELLSQLGSMQVDAQGHSVAVMPDRVQVLTQLSLNRLDLRHGLRDALMSPFAMNVAKHLVRKLTEAGILVEGRKAKEASQKLLENESSIKSKVDKLQLPERSISAKEINDHGTRTTISGAP